VIYGLRQDEDFTARWTAGPIQRNETEALANLLESEGARKFSQDAAAQMTSKALNALSEAQAEGEASNALNDLANRLLNRDV